MHSTASHIALLAPVPLEHLQDGTDICKREGRVAFGSRAWELFRELDLQRKGMLVDVYIYPSQKSVARGFHASWHGIYIGHVESQNGAHPEGMRVRPPSTAKYSEDNIGYWAVFWEVTNLRELSTAERIPLSYLTGFGKPKAYKVGFIPEGPLLIEHP